MSALILSTVKFYYAVESLYLVWISDSPAFGIFSRDCFSAYFKSDDHFSVVSYTSANYFSISDNAVHVESSDKNQVML